MTQKVLQTVTVTLEVPEDQPLPESFRLSPHLSSAMLALFRLGIQESLVSGDEHE